jgi:hypothetical protein
MKTIQNYQSALKMFGRLSPRKRRPYSTPNHIQNSLAVAMLLAATAVPALARDAASNPNGTFVDKWGTTFTFALCGNGTTLCGTLDVLKGKSATKENLAYVGKQVMQAQQVKANTWKGKLEAGGMSAEATATQITPDTIEIRGCRAILCGTVVYRRL